jgi:hypothetical protein
MPGDNRVSISLDSFAVSVYLHNSYTWEADMEHALFWFILAVACGALAGLLMDRWLGMRDR